MIHQYKLGGYDIVLDVCSGSIHVVDDVAYDMIAMFEQNDREGGGKHPEIARFPPCAGPFLFGGVPDADAAGKEPAQQGAGFSAAFHGETEEKIRIVSFIGRVQFFDRRHTLSSDKTQYAMSRSNVTVSPYPVSICVITKCAVPCAGAFSGIGMITSVL